MCEFDGIRKGNYFGGELIGRSEVEVRLGKFKNRDVITGEMIKGRGDRVVDWIWRLCYMAFECAVSEDWGSAVIVPLCKRKERGLNVRTIQSVCRFYRFGECVR